MRTILNFNSGVDKSKYLILLLYLSVTLFSFGGSVDSSVQRDSLVINKETKLIEILSNPIQDSYLADISQFNFTSFEEANRYFLQLGDNLIQFKVIWDSKQVQAILDRTGDRSDWKVKEWNEYFKQKSEW